MQVARVDCLVRQGTGLQMVPCISSLPLLPSVQDLCLLRLHGLRRLEATATFYKTCLPSAQTVQTAQTDHRFCSDGLGDATCRRSFWMDMTRIDRFRREDLNRR